jgi:hypothetical protein
MDEKQILESCLTLLRALPPISEVSLRESREAGEKYQWDGIADIKAGNNKWSWCIEVKRHLAPQSLPYLLSLKKKAVQMKDSNIVLCADYVTPNVARHLQDEDINFIDANGNAFLNLPGILYVYVEGRKPSRPTSLKTGRLFQPSGLQVLFSLLVNPDAVNLPYRNIAEQSGVALGTVGWMMRELRDKGYLEPVGKRQYRLMNKHTLMDNWVTSYADRLRPKLIIGRYRPHEEDLDLVLDKLKNHMEKGSRGWAVTGGFGADRLIHLYKGNTLNVFIENDPTDMLAGLRWLPSPQGRVTFLRLFSPHVYFQPMSGLRDHVAHPLLIYAELMHIGKERDRETAQIIYHRFLEDLFDKD